ncbi:MAG: hypothetical protein HY678_02225 [Chloroflexi bacterium]|nr:hypothetical protein [Chloroflexota bacterium]
MNDPIRHSPTLTDFDLDFVVGEAAPDAQNKQRLKELIREDEDFRSALLGDDHLFQRVMADEQVFLKISPALYFEILLRRALKELQAATHTVERTGAQRIPVFDTREVTRFLSEPHVLEYLAQMLASFTRIRSYVTQVRIAPGIRRRVRFNDMDVDSLVTLCSAADEDQRFGFYKRIGDVCLFVSGVFPGFVQHTRYPASGQPRPSTARGPRRSLEDYEREGQRYYGLAEAHPSARALGMSEIFGLLREHFTSARKPLNFLATQYLHSRSKSLFGVSSG